MPTNAEGAPSDSWDEVLDNLTYHVDGTPVPLEDGEFVLKPMPGAATFIANYSRRPFLAQGDLDGDGVEDDVATILVNQPGGSGAFIHLAVVVTGGNPENVATVSLGDRTRVESLTVDGGAVVLAGRRHGPDDPLCCPSQAFTQGFKLEGGTLTPTRITGD